MKTILFLENGTYGGGSFESLFLLVTHLDKNRFRPVAVFVNKSAYVERLKEQGVIVELIHDVLYSADKRSIGVRLLVRALLLLKSSFPRFTIRWESILHRRTIRALRELIKVHHVDLVHLNNQGLRDLYGVIVAAKMRIPCVSYLRSARVTYVPYSVARFLNAHVEQFIANSHYAKKYWVGLGIDSSKVKVVHNAIDDTPVQALDVHKEWGIDTAAKHVVGCIGNLTEGKGQEFLIRAFQRVLLQEPQTVLLVVGGGPKQAPLKQLITALNMTGKVIFAGYNSRARQIIAGLDLLVLPSQTETFGRTLLEAMSVGTPVVATRVGGIPEIVEHERNGLLMEYGDEKGIAGAIYTMLHDQGLRARCVEAGKKIVRERFEIEPHVRDIEQIYDSLC